MTGQWGREAGALLKSGLGIITFMTLIGSAAQFAAQIFLARMLAPEGFGLFNSAVAWAALLVPLATLGIPNLWQRLFGEEGEAAAPYLRAGATILLATAVAATVLIAGVGWLAGASAAFVFLSTLVLLRVGQDALGGALQVERAYRSFAWLQCWPYLGRLALILGLLLFVARDGVLDVLVVAKAHAVFWAAAAIIVFLQLRAATRRHSVTERRPAVARRLLSDGMAFMTSNFGWAIHSQVAIVMASLFFGHRDTGYLAAALAISNGGALVLSVIYQRFFVPRMFQDRHREPARFIRYIAPGFGWSAMLGLALALALLVISGLLLIPLLGPDYAPSTRLLMLLAIAIGFQAPLNHFSGALVGQDDIRFRSRSIWLALGVELLIMAIAVVLQSLPLLVIAIIAYEAMLAIIFGMRAFAIRRAVVAELGA